MMDGQPSFLGTYLSSLAPILQREDLVEIAINPDGKVWIERNTGSSSMLQLRKIAPAISLCGLTTLKANSSETTNCTITSAMMSCTRSETTLINIKSTSKSSSGWCGADSRRPCSGATGASPGIFVCVAY